MIFILVFFILRRRSPGCGDVLRAQEACREVLDLFVCTCMRLCGFRALTALCFWFLDFFLAGRNQVRQNQKQRNQEPWRRARIPTSPSVLLLLSFSSCTASLSRSSTLGSYFLFCFTALCDAFVERMFLTCVSGMTLERSLRKHIPGTRMLKWYKSLVYYFISFGN